MAIIFLSNNMFILKLNSNSNFFLGNVDFFFLMLENIMITTLQALIEIKDIIDIKDTSHIIYIIDLIDLIDIIDIK